MKPSLLVISDGNGVDTPKFKKWPFYLKLMLSKTHQVFNYSIIGAGNEIIFMQLADALRKQHIDHALIQWSIPQRLDVVADDFWVAEAKKDPVYHFNLITNNEQPWWITSASKNQYVKNYHETYVHQWQAKQRSQAYMLAAAELCKTHKVGFTFSLCYNFSFESPLIDDLLNYSWAWHEPNQGLSEFRSHSKHHHYDTGLPQPHSLIQLDWIDQVLKPNCSIIDYDQKTFYNIEQTLVKQCSK